MTAKQSAAERQRLRMQAGATRRAEPDVPPSGKTAVRSASARITIDLTPVAHRQATDWTAMAARELDVTRVTLADTVRATFIAVALHPEVSAVVLDIIRQLQDDK